MSSEFQHMIAQPDKYFVNPKQVEAHADLSTEQKTQILISWKSILIELMEADNENMASNSQNDVDDLMVAVSDALHRLEH